MKTMQRLGSAIVLGGFGLFALVACATPDDSREESTESVDDAVDVDENVAEAKDDLKWIGNRQCGSNVCGPGTFCCNSSCGTCAPLGGACTQQYCAPTE